jgi:replicative DNA helicase
MASDSSRLSTSLQENLLVLLCYHDKASILIRNAVEPHLFSAHIYREIIQRVYDYIDQYKRPPGDHLPDLLEDELSSDKPSAKLYLELLEAVHEMRGKVNEEYALNQLEAFVRKQTLKSSIIRASEAIADDDLDRAEEDLNAGMKTRLSVFAPGMTLAQGLNVSLSGQVRKDIIPTGIVGLDKANFGPARGELHLFIGPPKVGKSWWLVHMTKQFLVHRMKVAVVTLELSEAAWCQRLIQCLFSLPRHKAKIPVTRLRVDDLGRLLRFERETITERMSLDDSGARVYLEKKLMRFYTRDNVVIKQFPAGMLTVRGLINYLDMLERAQGFIPDFLVIDYPDYMVIDPKNYRLEAGALYNDLRGMAVSHNIGVVVASKSNREGAKARLVSETHAGEDFSRVFTADSILTYSQTNDEKKLGLARLFASNTRVADRDGFVLLLSQAYQIGQFALDSVQMTDAAWGHVESLVANDPVGE